MGVIYTSNYKLVAKRLTHRATGRGSWSIGQPIGQLIGQQPAFVLVKYMYRKFTPTPMHQPCCKAQLSICRYTPNQPRLHVTVNQQKLRLR